MEKLKSLKQTKVIQILENNGFKKVKSGKHITFKKIQNGRTLTTWVSHHRKITVFVIQYIVKQTEKHREEFES